MVIAQPRCRPTRSPDLNALAESVNATFKEELIHRKAWRTRTDMEIEVAAWVGWHNHHRIHRTLGDIAPAEYEITTLRSKPLYPTEADNPASKKAGVHHAEPETDAKRRFADEYAGTGLPDHPRAGPQVTGLLSRCHGSMN